MELSRYIVEAVTLEGRSYREVAAAYGVSKSWVAKVVSRYRAGGYEALMPASRRPKDSPSRISVELEDEIVCLRKLLVDQGLDAGAATIHYHLSRTHDAVPSESTIYRTLRRRGFITRSRASILARAGTASKQTCPTNAGSQTSPTGTSPTAPAWRSALGRKTPSVVYHARDKARPVGPKIILGKETRVRRDKIDKTGVITIRYRSKLHHVGIGRDFRGIRVIVLIDGLDIRILSEQGELIRQLVLDPSKDYQGTGRPPGPPKGRLLGPRKPRSYTMS